IAGVEEIESVSDTHKKSETNQQVSDFYTTEGSVNGSLTDRHYPRVPFCYFAKLTLLHTHLPFSALHPDIRL
ncbi:hypothetical protein, partial [Aeromonas veronii]|uniref:hypothetical protein n=1 Tax=Aeromonas veronii TaxID=654 RepID=UPI001F2C5D69